MALVNEGLREVHCAVVYCGPGSCGKTSNLSHIFQLAPSEARGDVLSVPAEVDPSLTFEVLPLDLGAVAGYRVRLNLYTVPGLLLGERGRAAILRGADGVVFVADSSRDRFRDNLLSHVEMTRILDRCHRGRGPVPLVLQYNKRDLPDAVPVPVLSARLNPTAAPSVEAVANTGLGVFATLQAISRLVIERVERLASL